MAELHISLVYSQGPRETTELSLSLPEGSTVADALAPYPELLSSSKSIGIYGRQVSLETALEDQDRIELYRPLRVDPKTARRERFAQQGARSAGLFAQRRPGAKPGY